MAVYVVGLIVGAATTVAPLLYMMHYERCVARILAAQPGFDPALFPSVPSLALMHGITAVGAVVLLVSITMVALIGLRQLRSADQMSAEPASPAPAPVHPGHGSDERMDTEEETEI